jgi:hypothetical protein
MKQELLEYLVRSCVKEVLTQSTIQEGDPEIKGAAAPPADGQGTAEQPEIPNEKDSIPEEPKEPETPQSPELKGVVLVNPRDKSKLQKVPLKSGDDMSLDRNLHQLSAALAGSNVKTAASTLRMVKDAVKNPNTITYLYLGKYDPNSDEIFLMADKSLQVAKDASVPPTELGTSTSKMVPDDFKASTTTDNYGQNINAQPPTPNGINEIMLKKYISKVVSEILNKK